MSFFTSAQLPLTRCFVRPGGCLRLGRQLLDPRNATSYTLARYASQSNRPPYTPKRSRSRKFAQRQNAEPDVGKRELDPSKKAFLTLLNISKGTKKISPPGPKSISPEIFPTVVETQTDPNDGAFKTIEISEEEAAIQQRILKKRREILWPGIWTVFALAGTWGTLAYLDARSSNGSQATGAHLTERAKISQSWFLRPSVVKEGIIAGWNELDKLTIGIVVASVGIHLLKKSPLPIWEMLIHITGEKRYTAFTYPFVHSYAWCGLVLTRRCTLPRWRCLSCCSTPCQRPALY
jgi:hypothetical protein